MVCDMVRGKNAAVALDELRFTRKAAAPLVAKLLDSAIANAQQKTPSARSTWIDALREDDPRGQGARPAHASAGARARRAAPRAIAKGMSHITVVLDEREEG